MILYWTIILDFWEAYYYLSDHVDKSSDFLDEPWLPSIESRQFAQEA